VGVEVSTLSVSFNQFAAGEESLRAIVVAGLEVDLREPECIIVILYSLQSVCKLK
jgi:hypothetical protein